MKYATFQPDTCQTDGDVDPQTYIQQNTALKYRQYWLRM